MHKTLMVLRREYLDRVRRKSFWLGIALFPLLMAGLIVAQFLLIDLHPEEQVRIAIVDATGRFAAPLEHRLGQERLAGGEPRYVIESVPVDGDADRTRRALERRVLEGDLFGIVTVGEDIESDGNFRLYCRNVGNMMVNLAIRQSLREAVIGQRLEDGRLALDRSRLTELIAPVRLDTFQVSAGGESSRRGFVGAYFGTFGFVLLLYTSLLVYGMAAMRGILEEKSSRIMEVLLGALTPGQLVTGKILGIGLVGLTQMALYFVVSAVATPALAGFGPDSDVGRTLELFSPGRMSWLVVFFLLGYFLYVALFTAIGAVCNTEQETQNLQGPVTVCLVIPMVATFFFVNNPDSTVSVIASMIPLFTPMVMFMRISLLQPPAWQIALSIGLMLLAIVLVFRVVAKIFRIGVLMYGKRPSIPEIIRWARA